MELDDVQMAAWLDAMAAFLKLPIEAGDRDAISANMHFIASLVAEFPLDDTVEPATIFRA